MNSLSRCAGLIASLLGLLFLSGCVHSPPSNPWDPLQPVNRAVYKFNDTADRYVLRPIAKSYNKITPARVQQSVSDFFANLQEPITMANSLLQLKFGKFNQALGRFMINSSFGIGGLFDVASALDVPNPDEDLGQTLGYYGLGTGPYLVIPLLGPSDPRDFIGQLGDEFADPLSYTTQIEGVGNTNAHLPYLLRGLDGLNLRASFLDVDKTLQQQFDPYAFVRTYYLEQRHNAVDDNHRPADSMDY